MNRRESIVAVVALGAAAGPIAPSLNEGEVCDVPTRRTRCLERQAEYCLHIRRSVIIPALVA